MKYLLIRFGLTAYDGPMKVMLKQIQLWLPSKAQFEGLSNRLKLLDDEIRLLIWVEG